MVSKPLLERQRAIGPQRERPVPALEWEAAERLFVQIQPQAGTFGQLKVAIDQLDRLIHTCRGAVTSSSG